MTEKNATETPQTETPTKVARYGNSKCLKCGSTEAYGCNVPQAQEYRGLEIITRQYVRCERCGQIRVEKTVEPLKRELPAQEPENQNNVQRTDGRGNQAIQNEGDRVSPEQSGDIEREQQLSGDELHDQPSERVEDTGGTDQGTKSKKKGK